MVMTCVLDGGGSTHAAEEDGGVPEELRVVIADDEYLVREGARSVLSAVPGIEVVGLAGDPAELMTLLEQTLPDAVVLDIKMPPTHRAEGIEAAHLIRE